MLRNPKAQRALRAVLLAATLLATAGIASGCATSETVTFRTLRPVLSPFSEVTLEIDHDKQTIQPVPDPVIIWFDSQNPLSQILWTVRCVKGGGDTKDDVTCPPGTTVIIRPKEGCSTTLFGTTEGAPAGEIHIRAPHNAVASGTPSPDETRALLAATGKAETYCDGTSKSEGVPMELSQSKHDTKWAYEIEVRRRGESFRRDPAVWIETDG